MASVKCALVLVALLALGVELGQAQTCSERLDACYSTYAAVQSSSDCGAYIVLNECVTALTRNGVCSQSDVSSHTNVQTGYNNHPGCSGTTLPKASLIGILIAAVVGLLFRA